jgi:uncharacterized protein (DUF2062 family)
MNWAQREVMDIRKSSLEDPAYAQFAWSRYKRLMLWMVLASFIAVVGGLFLLSLFIGAIPLHMMIATALGIFFSVLLASALMGLVFLSAGSGHDDVIEDPFEDQG